MQAGVAKLADALGSGPNGSNSLEVQILSPALINHYGKTTK